MNGKNKKFSPTQQAFRSGVLLFCNAPPRDGTRGRKELHRDALLFGASGNRWRQRLEPEMGPKKPPAQIYRRASHPRRKKEKKEQGEQQKVSLSLPLNGNSFVKRRKEVIHQRLDRPSVVPKIVIKFLGFDKSLSYICIFCTCIPYSLLSNGSMGQGTMDKVKNESDSAKNLAQKSKTWVNKAGYTAQDAPRTRTFHLRKKTRDGQTDRRTDRRTDGHDLI